MGLRECESVERLPDDPADCYAMRVQKAIIRMRGLALTPVEYDLVWRWEHEDAIPITVVFEAIKVKAKRMKDGQRLRLLWIQDDLAEVYDNWRRAVGVVRG